MRVSTIKELPAKQQVLMRSLKWAWNDGHPDTVCICRKCPEWGARDPYTGRLMEYDMWVQGYATTAAALVQRGILVKEEYMTYSITSYGMELIYHD